MDRGTTSFLFFQGFVDPLNLWGLYVWRVGLPERRVSPFRFWLFSALELLPNAFLYPLAPTQPDPESASRPKISRKKIAG